MANTLVYYVTRAVHGMSISWSFGLHVNVIVRGQRLQGCRNLILLGQAVTDFAKGSKMEEFTLVWGPWNNVYISFLRDFLVDYEPNSAIGINSLGKG